MTQELRKGPKNIFSKYTPHHSTIDGHSGRYGEDSVWVNLESDDKGVPIICPRHKVHQIERHQGLMCDEVLLAGKNIGCPIP
jgi:hypothetical protein